MKVPPQKATASWGPRFVADAMLGRLARRLRMLGYDILYQRDIDDGGLLRLAMREDRIILTRDTRLAMRKAAIGRTFLISSEDPVKQVKEITQAFPALSCVPVRCTICNGALKPVEDRQSVLGQVPEHVFHSASGFFKCPNCGHIYWEGSHMEHFKGELLSIRASGEEEED